MKGKRKRVHTELKEMIRDKRLFQKNKMRPFGKKFTEVRIEIDDEGFEVKNLPVSDAAGKIDEETLVFVEFDNGGQISHSLLKYYYWLEKLVSKPKKVYLFHIYGSEFAPNVDKKNRNYYFHRRLVVFLLGKIREIFKDFEYIPSVPLLPGRGSGFVTAADAYEWFEEEFKKKFGDY